MVTASQATRLWPRKGRNRTPTGVAVTARTGPLGALCGKRLLVIADGQNLIHGAKDLGYRLCWSALRQRIEEAAESASYYAVAAHYAGDCRPGTKLQEQGWSPCLKTVRGAWRNGAWRRDANADNLFALAAGALCRGMAVDLVVVGTGDGQLAEDVAEGIQTLMGPCLVATLSLAGSTAARLDARRSKLIAANIEIGRDCLIALNASRLSIDSAQSQLNSERAASTISV